MKKNECHLLGYGFQTIQCTKLQHKASIFLSTEPYPAHDEKLLGSGTTLPNHLQLKQNTYRDINGTVLVQQFS
jgi:hypothetical protein